MIQRLVPSWREGPYGIRVKRVCPHGGGAELTAGHICFQAT